MGGTVPSPYTYDANGNTLTKVQSTVNGQQSTSYTYDNKNQLVKVQMPSGDTIEYVYDGNGNRYSKTITPSGGTPTTRYYSYDTSNNIISEYSKTGDTINMLIKYIRDNKGQVIEQIQNNKTYFYLYDGQDHITALTDESGSVVQTYAYDEYGNITNQTGNIYNPIVYTNYYWDSEISLYHLKTRYYDPSIGRFITRDKKGNEDQYESAQSSNFYIYAKNDPINRYDPLGKAAIHKKWFQAVVEVREALDWAMNRLKITGTITWKGKKVLATTIDEKNTGATPISRYYGPLFAVWNYNAYKKVYRPKKGFTHGARFYSTFNFTGTSFTNYLCQSIKFKNGYNAKSAVRAKLDPKGKKIWQWKSIKKWQIEKLIY